MEIERPSENLTQEQLLDLYRIMLRIRKFEDEVYRLFLEGLVQGTTHLGQGQEAIPAGVISALQPTDFVTMTYRGHGHAVARGIDLAGAFSELLGRRTGVCKGKGGSMHLMDFSKNLIGAFAIVGAGLPVAVGAAMSAQYRGTHQVSATFFGDGAANIGAFHEAMNLAAVHHAPVIFICENNLYGEFTRINETTPFEDLTRRAEAYAMPAYLVDGNDVLAVYDTTVGAVEHARTGKGPVFLECKTYRHYGHSRTDPASYRPKEEVDEWMRRDPLEKFRATLLEVRNVRETTLKGIDDQLTREITRASEIAREGPWPEIAEIMTNVYV